MNEQKLIGEWVMNEQKLMVWGKLNITPMNEQKLIREWEEKHETKLFWEEIFGIPTISFYLEV